MATKTIGSIDIANSLMGERMYSAPIQRKKSIGPPITPIKQPHFASESLSLLISTKKFKMHPNSQMCGLVKKKVWS